MKLLELLKEGKVLEQQRTQVLKALLRETSPGKNRFGELLEVIQRLSKTIGDVLTKSYNDESPIDPDIFVRWWDKPGRVQKNEDLTFWSSQKDLRDIFLPHYSKKYRPVLGRLVRRMTNEKTFRDLLQEVHVPLQIKIYLHMILQEYFCGGEVENSAQPHPLFPVFLNQVLVSHQTVTSMISETGPPKKNRETFKKLFIEKLAKLLGSLFAGSGTILIKILQRISHNAKDRKIMGVSFSEIGETVYSGVPFMNTAEMEIIQPNLSVRDIYPKLGKMLGSASIAQAHMAERMPGVDGSVPPVSVVKFVKPIYLLYALCDVDFFLQSCLRKIPQYVGYYVKNDDDAAIKMESQVGSVILYFAKMYLSELSYDQETKNTDLGHKYYSTTIPLNVLSKGPRKDALTIKVARNLKATSNTHPFPSIALELAHGIELSELLKLLKAPQKLEHRFPELVDRQTLQNYLKGIYLCTVALYSQFLKAALFSKESFFHSDLHPGNVWVNLPKEQETVTLIDFGACGSLSKNSRCLLVDCIIQSLSFTEPIDIDPSERISNEKIPNETEVSKFVSTFFPEPTEELIQTLQRNWKDVQEIHARNISLAYKMIKRFRSLCMVKDKYVTPVKPESLLVYSSFKNGSSSLSIGNLFIKWIRSAEHAGTCTFHDTLQYGIAMSYLEDMAANVYRVCIDHSVDVPPILIADLIAVMLRKKANLWQTAPTLLHYGKQLAISRLLRGGDWSTCSAKILRHQKDTMKEKKRLK